MNNKVLIYKSSVLVLYFLFSTFTLLYSHNDIVFQKISVEQGLTQFSVTSIYQDEYGTLWFGTREGVNRYNGYSIEVMYPNLGELYPSESLIFNICGDKDGHVFIQTQNGCVEYNVLTSFQSTISHGVVRAMNIWSIRFINSKRQSYLPI